MRNYALQFAVLIFLAGTSCVEKIDIEKEKEAIKEVIENETNSYIKRDFAQQSKSFKQDDFLTMVGVGEGYFVSGVGWDEISEGYLRDYKSNPDPVPGSYFFNNYRIKVYTQTALAIYDEIVHDDEGQFLRKHISTRVLEKVDGEWKIIYLSWVDLESTERL